MQLKDKAYDGYDTTRYGEFSTHRAQLVSSYSHHATQISLAIVTSDAEAIHSQLSFDESRFAHTGGFYRGPGDPCVPSGFARSTVNPNAQRRER